MFSPAVETLFRAVSLLCCGASLFGALYAVAAAVCVRRFAARAPSATAPTMPGVSLLKPLCGAETGLAAALESFCTQDYAGELQVIFGVQSASDPAIAIVEALRARHPDLDMTLVVDAMTHGANRKIANLINMASKIRHAIVVLADSDIVAPRDHLAQCVAALGADGVGLVTCLYRGEPQTNFWSRLAAGAIDWHFTPSVLVGLATGLAHPCFGSTIALRRETLEAIGGFTAFADQLADDYAVGAAVRGLGLTIALPPLVVGHLCQETSFDELWRHELRWARTIRLVDPVGFFGSGVTHAVPLALLGAAFSGFDAVTLAVLALALAARVWLQRNMMHYLHAGSRDLALLVVRDLLSFVLFLASFFALRVKWRSFDYTVAPGGTLVPVKKDLEP